MGRGTNELNLMTGIGIDTISLGIVGIALVDVIEVEMSLAGASVVALWNVFSRGAGEDERRLVLHERLLRKNEGRRHTGWSLKTCSCVLWPTQALVVLLAS